MGEYWIRYSKLDTEHTVDKLAGIIVSTAVFLCFVFVFKMQQMLPPVVSRQGQRTPWQQHGKDAGGAESWAVREGGETGREEQGQ